MAERVDRIDMDEAEWLYTMYADMEVFNLSSWGKVRLLGLLMNLICKHEGRHVWPDKLSAMFDKIQGTQADHQLDREIDDVITAAHIEALAEKRKEFPDHEDFHTAFAQGFNHSRNNGHPRKAAE